MYLFLDTETTGLSKARDRIVQIAWIIADEDGAVSLTKSRIIRPSGFNIPSRAASIHGITDAHAQQAGVPLIAVLNEFINDAHNIDCVIAHNAPFDLGFLQRECVEADLIYPFKGVPTICTMMSSVAFCRLPKLNGLPGFKRPSLQELHFHLFREYFDGEHDALFDTKACMRCFYELKKHRVIEPPTTKIRHDLRGSTVNQHKQEIVCKPKSDVGTKHSPADRKNQELSKSLLEIARLKEQIKQEQTRIRELENEVEYYESEEGRFYEAANSVDKEWRKAAASNPKCPKHILSDLLMDEEDIEVLECLAGNPSLGEQEISSLIKTYADEWRILEAAAKNPKCTCDSLAFISWVTEFELYALVEKNPSFSNQAIESELQLHAADPDPKVRSLIAEFSECPTYLLRALAYDEEAEVRASVSRNPKCPEFLLSILDKDHDERVRDSALNNPNHQLYKTKRALESNDHSYLARFKTQADIGVDVAIFLAEHLNCPKEILASLAGHWDANVRIAVAKHHACFQHTYLKLADDQDGQVRLAVANNQSIELKVMEQLSNSPFYEYRLAIANNPACPREILIRLSSDPESKVRKAIKKRYYTPILTRESSTPSGQ